eukprot:TRINITY_DN605_c0_g4_i1.p1 TRINITY_DN605_c0_g4~~TRINITY_DN605_c0_g4_i1.p1  ORF type:complete len:1110 (+),score=276.35 TRINITY_DN605_c0_g4_i1:332-3331(+)
MKDLASSDEFIVVSALRFLDSLYLKDLLEFLNTMQSEIERLIIRCSSEEVRSAAASLLSRTLLRLVRTQGASCLKDEKNMLSLLGDALMDADDHASSCAFLGLRQLFDAIQEDMEVVRVVATRFAKEHRMLIARVLSMSVPLRWPSVMPLTIITACANLPASETHNQMPMNEFIRSFLRPQLSSLDPSLVFEVSMHIFGVMKNRAEDVGVVLNSLLSVLRRRDILYGVDEIAKAIRPWLREMRHQKEQLIHTGVLLMSILHQIHNVHVRLGVLSAVCRPLVSESLNTAVSSVLLGTTSKLDALLLIDHLDVKDAMQRNFFVKCELISTLCEETIQIFEEEILDDISTVMKPGSGLLSLLKCIPKARRVRFKGWCRLAMEILFFSREVIEGDDHSFTSQKEVSIISHFRLLSLVLCLLDDHISEESDPFGHHHAVDVHDAVRGKAEGFDFRDDMWILEDNDIVVQKSLQQMLTQHFVVSRLGTLPSQPHGIRVMFLSLFARYCPQSSIRDEIVDAMNKLLVELIGQGDECANTTMASTLLESWSWMSLKGVYDEVERALRLVDEKSTMEDSLLSLQRRWKSILDEIGTLSLRAKKTDGSDVTVNEDEVYRKLKGRSALEMRFDAYHPIFFSSPTYCSLFPMDFIPELPPAILQYQSRDEPSLPLTKAEKAIRRSQSLANHYTIASSLSDDLRVEARCEYRKGVSEIDLQWRITNTTESDLENVSVSVIVGGDLVEKDYGGQGSSVVSKLKPLDSYESATYFLLVSLDHVQECTFEIILHYHSSSRATGALALPLLMEGSQQRECTIRTRPLHLKISGLLKRQIMTESTWLRVWRQLPHSVIVQTTVQDAPVLFEHMEHSDVFSHVISSPHGSNGHTNAAHVDPREPSSATTKAGVFENKLLSCATWTEDPFLLLASVKNAPNGGSIVLWEFRCFKRMVLKMMEESFLEWVRDGLGFAGDIKLDDIVEELLQTPFAGHSRTPSEECAKAVKEYTAMTKRQK